jgi:uncharacterized protein YjiS (DUF1127 family)
MFNNFRTRYARWKKFSRTYSELQNLSDRDLADIGISRSDIPRIARESVRS